MISSAYEVSYVIQWVVISVLVAGLAALYSAFGALTKRLGMLEPALDLSSIGPRVGDEIAVGEVLDEGGLPVGGVAAWVFVTPGCAGCARAKTALQGAAPGDFGERVAVVVNGPRQQAEAWVNDLPAWVSFVPDEEGRLFGLFNVSLTPYYVLLDDRLRCIAKGASEAVLLAPIQELPVPNAPAESTQGLQFQSRRVLQAKLEEDR